MGIGCYSIDREKSEFRKQIVDGIETSYQSYTISRVLDIPSLKTFPSNQNIETDKIIGNFSSTNSLANAFTNHSESCSKLAQLNGQNSEETKFGLKSILPNFPYSPFNSPRVSPEHRLHPQGLQSFYSNSYGSLQRDVSSISVTEDSNRVVHLNQYQIRQQLGQGSYGLVQLAYNSKDSTYYAMKSLSKKKLMKSSGLFNRPPPIRKSTSSMSSMGNKSPQHTIDPLQKIYKEIAFHKKLNHSNIVKLIEVLDDPSQEFLYMVFEYMENGPVMEIGKDSPFPEIKARKYIIDTLLGLEYLHYQKIIHRDIKPANLLLSKLDVIKISDFGVSNEFTGDDVYLSSTVGSPAFMAPESVRDGDHCFTGKALDIWALGITFYAFLFGKVPFENCNRFLLYQMIINNPILYPENPSVSTNVMDLLRKMLNKNPMERIKIPDIKIHPWITNEGKNPLPTEAENCGLTSIDVNEDEVANSIRFVPRLETVIKIKMLLKQKSFANPLRFGSVSRINETKNGTELLKDPSLLLQRSSFDALSPMPDDRKFIKNLKIDEVN